VLKTKKARAIRFLKGAIRGEVTALLELFHGK